MSAKQVLRCAQDDNFPMNASFARSIPLTTCARCGTSFGQEKRGKRYRSSGSRPSRATCPGSVVTAAASPAARTAAIVSRV